MRQRCPLDIGFEVRALVFTLHHKKHNEAGESKQTLSHDHSYVISWLRPQLLLLLVNAIVLSFGGILNRNE